MKFFRRRREQPELPQNNSPTDAPTEQTEELTRVVAEPAPIEYMRIVATYRLGCIACPNKREIHVPGSNKLTISPLRIPFSMLVHALHVGASSIDVSNADCRPGSYCPYVEEIGSLAAQIETDPFVLQAQTGLEADCDNLRFPE